MRIRVTHAIGQRCVWNGGAEGDGCIGIVHTGRLKGGHLRGWTHRAGHGRCGGIAAIAVAVAAAAAAVGELLAVTAGRQGHRAAMGSVVELLLRCAALQR